MIRLTDQQIADIKDRNRIDEIAGRAVTLRNGRADRKWPHGKSVGPCPFCSKDFQSKTDARFECDGDRWVCGACADGGDVITYIAKEKGLDPKRDFVAILEHLGGGREVSETPASARRAGGVAYRAGKALDARPDAWSDDLKRAFYEGWKTADRAELSNARYRERERARLYENYWHKAERWRGDGMLAGYFKLRGLLVPENARIGLMNDCPMFADGREREPLEVHRGPAMLCPIFGPRPGADADAIERGDPSAFRFSGLHFTWLDLSQSKGKAAIRHPETGELLPAKKSRGTKQGGYIDLGGCAAHEADRVVSGEGNENTFAGYTILRRAGRDISRTHFRSGIDLGNLAGKALDRLNHPTLKTDKGRTRKVPGCEPDLASPAMPVPRRARRLVYMCDGDSDPFITKCAMTRAELRRRRDDLKQVMMWPGDGADWNDRLL